MQMNPADNRTNLPDNYIENTLSNLPERQRRRFLLGQWLEDDDGALWNRTMIDSARVTEVPPLSRVVIGVDPAVTGGKASDCTGIIAAVAHVDCNGVNGVLFQRAGIEERAEAFVPVKAGNIRNSADKCNREIQCYFDAVYHTAAVIFGDLTIEIA